MLCGRLEWREPPDFLDWYVHTAGTSKVPPAFHLWSGLALVAAAVQNRVWYEKFRGHKLQPNLFVMLIGPSGTGKGQALREAHALTKGLPDADYDRIQPYRGKITPQALITRLADANLPAYIWLLTPELSMAVGTGTKADDWVKHMTELYEGDYVLNDSTRGRGQYQVIDPCINWTSGTTREWLLDSVTRRDILSGFFARVCAVQGERTDTRLLDPIYPEDHGVCLAWLRSYVHGLTKLEGPVALAVDAAECRRLWYATRPTPTDELLWPFWDRQDDLVLKLATLLAVADRHSRIIRARHMEDAIGLTEWLATTMPTLLSFAYRTEDTDAIDFILAWARRQERGWIQHSRLVKAASNRGIVAARLKTAIDTLVDRHDLERTAVGGGGRRYRLNGSGESLESVPGATH